MHSCNLKHREEGGFQVWGNKTNKIETCHGALKMGAPCTWQKLLLETEIYPLSLPTNDLLKRHHNEELPEDWTHKGTSIMELQSCLNVEGHHRSWSTVDSHHIQLWNTKFLTPGLHSTHISPAPQGLPLSPISENQSSSFLLEDCFWQL